jgi:hypothetical protein
MFCFAGIKVTKNSGILLNKIFNLASDQDYSRETIRLQAQGTQFR